jgi:hypothetical protein
MSDDADAPKSKAGEPKPPKMKAEDNPWYLLATLYGVPEKWVFVNEANPQDEELRSKNRVVWNRYFGAGLDEKTQAHLIVRHRPEELKPFSPEDLQEVEKAFAVRRGSKVSIALPPGNSRIDFTGVQFDQEIDFSHYIFTDCSFRGADFSDQAYFRDGTFLEGANFSGATFSFANFRCALFSGAADFQNATFSGVAYFRDAIFSGFVYFKDATRSALRGLTLLMTPISSRQSSLVGPIFTARPSPAGPTSPRQFTPNLLTSRARLFHAR